MDWGVAGGDRKQGQLEVVKENRRESVAPNEPFFLSRAHFTPQDARWAGLPVPAGSSLTHTTRMPSLGFLK